MIKKLIGIIVAVAVVVQHLGDFLRLLVADGARLEEGRQKAGQRPLEGPLQHLLSVGPLDGGPVHQGGYGSKRHQTHPVS